MEIMENTYLLNFQQTINWKKRSIVETANTLNFLTSMEHYPAISQNVTVVQASNESCHPKTLLFCCS